MNTYCSKCHRTYDGVTVKRARHRRGLCTDCNAEYLRQYRQRHARHINKQHREYNREYAAALRAAGVGK